MAKRRVEKYTLNNASTFVVLAVVNVLVFLGSLLPAEVGSDVSDSFGAIPYLWPLAFVDFIFIYAIMIHRRKWGALRILGIILLIPVGYIFLYFTFIIIGLVIGHF